MIVGTDTPKPGALDSEEALRMAAMKDTCGQAKDVWCHDPEGDGAIRLRTTSYRP
ncbi:MAG: hypothetical protein ABSG97_04110 [Sedimentisphaerales bacterium]